MDRATQIGIGLGLVAIIGANLMEGGNPSSLLMPPAILLVFGGTIGASVAGGTMTDAKNAVQSLVRAFTWKPVPPADLVPVVVSLADKARREGLLTLEEAVTEVGDEFLSRGVRLVVDGTDPEELREILEAELYAKKAEDKRSAKFFSDMGGYAPTIGIIGTVLGLVHVLGNLGDPSTLGEKIASAFVATLWGVMTANIFWFPLANRLKRVSAAECEQMELAIEGVLAIQAGSNPRLVAQKLNSMVSAGEAPKKEVA